MTNERADDRGPIRYRMEAAARGSRFAERSAHHAERDGDIRATSSQHRLFSLPSTSMTPRQRSAGIR